MKKWLKIILGGLLLVGVVFAGTWEGDEFGGVKRKTKLYDTKGRQMAVSQAETTKVYILWCKNLVADSIPGKADSSGYADTSGHSINPNWMYLTGENARGALAFQSDDGCIEDTLIWHIAARFNIPFGINTVIDKAGMGEIDSATLNRMHESGVEINSHTYSHPYLHTLTDDSLNWELYQSKKRLEEIIIDPDYHCKCFSYPYDARAGADSVVAAARRHYLFARGVGNVHEDSGTGLIDDWDPAHCYGQPIPFSVGYDSATNAQKMDSVLHKIRDEHLFYTMYMHGSDIPANVDTNLLRQMFKQISNFRDSIVVAHFSEINHWLSTNNQNTRMQKQKFLMGVEVYGPDTGLKVKGEDLGGYFEKGINVKGTTDLDSNVTIDVTTSSTPTVGLFLRYRNTNTVLGGSNCTALDVKADKCDGGNCKVDGNRTGIYTHAYGDTTNANSVDNIIKGIYGLASSYGNSRNEVMGGYFETGAGGLGRHYGSCNKASGTTDSSVIGTYGYAINQGSGNAIGVYGKVSTAGSGDHWAGLFDGNVKVDDSYPGTANERATVYSIVNDSINQPRYAIRGSAYNRFASAGSNAQSVGGYFEGKSMRAGNTATAFGVEAVGENAGSGTVYGGWFRAMNSGTGLHIGIHAESDSIAVYGKTNAANGKYAGWFDGDVEITGDLGISGTLQVGSGGTGIDKIEKLGDNLAIECGTDTFWAQDDSAGGGGATDSSDVSGWNYALLSEIRDTAKVTKVDSATVSHNSDSLNHKVEGSLRVQHADTAEFVNDTLSRSFVIQAIDTDHDFAFWMTPKAITLIKVSGVCNGGTNVIGVLMEYDGNAANPVVCNSSDWTFTTGEEETTSLSNASIDAGDYLGWKTESVSGTVSFFTLTFEYVLQ